MFYFINLQGSKASKKLEDFEFFRVLRALEVSFKTHLAV
jgi:hypothetical protein